MAVFDRLSIRVAAVGAGLCGIALALSPGVAQAGGYDCLQTTAGEAPAAAGAGVAGAGAGAAACAPISEMSGVPILPGPPVAPPPVIPPVAPPPVVPLPKHIALTPYTAKCVDDGPGVVYDNDDFADGNGPRGAGNASDCCAQCAAQDGCKFWSYNVDDAVTAPHGVCHWGALSYC